MMYSYAKLICGIEKALKYNQYGNIVNNAFSQIQHFFLFNKMKIKKDVFHIASSYIVHRYEQ